MPIPRRLRKPAAAHRNSVVAAVERAEQRLRGEIPSPFRYSSHSTDRSTTSATQLQTLIAAITKQVRHKFESTLTAHGAKSAIGYITNVIYQVLLGGTKLEIVAKRNLPSNVVFRDTLPLGELLQTINTEFLASERIDSLEITGKEPCAARRMAAGIVQDAFNRAVQPGGAE